MIWGIILLAAAFGFLSGVGKALQAKQMRDDIRRTREAVEKLSQ